MHIHHELLRSEEKRGVSDAMPRLGEHVAGRSWRLLVRGKRGEGFEQKHFRPAAVSHLLQQSHHRVHARIGARDDRDEEVGEAEMRMVNALLGDGGMRCKFLCDGRSVNVRGVKRS